MGRACCGAAGCKNRRTDPDHCGQCNNAYPSDGICEAAACTDEVCGLELSPTDAPGPICANTSCDGACCNTNQIRGGSSRQCCLAMGTATTSPALCSARRILRDHKG